MIDRPVPCPDAQRVGNGGGDIVFCRLNRLGHAKPFCQLGCDAGRKCAARTMRMRRWETFAVQLDGFVWRKQPVGAIFALAVGKMSALNYHIFHTTIQKNFGGALRILAVFNIDTRQCLRFGQIGGQYVRMRQQQALHGFDG